MFPALTGNLDLEALSGICGSISIACWVVVFSPQIIENFRRGSADGLSLLFLIVWLAGDVFNILGAVLQGVLPTMLILAVYYTLADVVLLGQCFYYRGFTLRDEPSPPLRASSPSPAEESYDDDTEIPSPVVPRKPSEQSSLLSNQRGPQYEAVHYNHFGGPSPASSATITAPPLLSQRRHSASSFLHPSVDGTHLSPATPFIESAKEPRPPRSLTMLQSILFNGSAIILVCAAGILGWYISQRSTHIKGDGGSSDTPQNLTMDPLGQVFGYLCAVLYLGSRLPQILLNYRRKSTEGVSLLFFLFACIGNLTYVLSILAYSPVCANSSSRHGRCRSDELAALYGRYILVNLSWLIGSFGTLLLDMCIFVQFFVYQDSNGAGDDETDESLRG
ncbi:PQ-loop-domain-containing protein [Aspergillus heteromorphus CBS 117.55]|uniref:PQ-loop-domain-containing protein n=1 Tax=Aspergillus heteromorphus CBS 117.55 TaxID=1448321 RepID=A0A317W307_9EURO|nr:PQ-loop-domain-containing protein [Aspergillus heteromorphus CBS 117.55]PWY79568.1 PQ-loop-domain-containing protein [Aspergillus heteromorphus CBS 117.55]